MKITMSEAVPHVINNSDTKILLGRIDELSTIIALMPGNVYWKARNHTYRGCNDNIAKLINLTDCQQIVGKTLFDFFEPDLAIKINAIDEQVMISGMEYAIEEEAVDKEGNKAYYLTRKVPLKNSDGEVIGLLGMSFDITERKQQEELLKIAKEQAEAASIAKSEFLSNMSHDLRTPFSGLIGLTEQLLLAEEEPLKKELLGYVLQSGRHLLALLNQILETAAMTEKGVDTKLVTFDLSRLVTSVAELMSVESRNKNLELRVIIDAKLPLLIIGDEVKLHRVLLNLLGNAIKFTQQGHVTLEVDFVRQTKTTLWIKFAVIDTGIGIPKDKLASIFERFTRLAPSFSSTYSGIGLGLHIAQSFIQDLGGALEVTSEVNKGSTFSCVIPFGFNI